jgi:hypothetical protein
MPQNHQTEASPIDGSLNSATGIKFWFAWPTEPTHEAEGLEGIGLPCNEPPSVQIVQQEAGEGVQVAAA